MERPVGAAEPDPEHVLPPSCPTPRSWRLPQTAPILGLSLTLILIVGCHVPRPEDAPARVRATGSLRYGADKEGGGPYVYPDPADPRAVTGFEVELMDLLTGALGPRPEFVQAQWDTLLPTLGTGRIDLVLNGYEWTPGRAERYLATRPYYVYQLQWLARRGGPIHAPDDLKRPRADGRPWRVGVLGGSGAEAYLREQHAGSVAVQYFNGATDALMAVRNGQADATLQDLPAARFYGDDYPALKTIGPPVGRGYYVAYLRKDDVAIRDALDVAIGRLIRNGALRALYERYGIWTDAQAELARLDGPPAAEGARAETLHGPALIARYGTTLLASAGLTVFLSCASMPLAMALGLFVALGRLYGPAPLRAALAAYVEFLRGTPLMLQLFVLFFLLPELGIELPALVAGVAGLAINYSAYEAEIYRAGLQAIPNGQMEAALALGMSRTLALRRVIVPQAVRIVIPPVTNDFIALFKDTSVCSVISLVELTKQYSILANSTGGVVEFAMATAVLYLAMSLPLSWLARGFEGRLAANRPEGGLMG